MTFIYALRETVGTHHEGGALCASKLSFRARTNRRSQLGHEDVAAARFGGPPCARGADALLWAHQRPTDDRHTLHLVAARDSREPGGQCGRTTPLWSRWRWCPPRRDCGSWLRDRTARPDLPPSAEVDGLAIDLRDAGWVPMDAHAMDSQGGYQMPAQMMPGAPAGDEMRLGIAVTLLNTDVEVREFNLGEEFVLVGGVIDGTVRLHSDTFGLLRRLDPGQRGQRRPLLRHDRARRGRSGARPALEPRAGRRSTLGIPLGDAGPPASPRLIGRAFPRRQEDPGTGRRQRERTHSFIGRSADLPVGCPPPAGGPAKPPAATRALDKEDPLCAIHPLCPKPGRGAQAPIGRYGATHLP